VTQVGSLRRCPAPVVVGTGSHLCGSGKGFLLGESVGSFEGVDSPVFVIPFVTVFQSSFTLFELKCLRVSSQADCCLRFSGSTASVSGCVL
jgi:hypothetical protein